MSDSNALAQPSNPLRNPSYPRRIHVGERAHWNGVVTSCRTKADEAAQVLATLGAHPKRPEIERAYAQILGARDQVEDAARRLPQEVGELYHEDKEKLEQAVAALERVWTSWTRLIS